MLSACSPVTTPEKPAQSESSHSEEKTTESLALPSVTPSPKPEMPTTTPEDSWRAGFGKFLYVPEEGAYADVFAEKQLEYIKAATRQSDQKKEAWRKTPDTSLRVVYMDETFQSPCADTYVGSSTPNVFFCKSDSGTTPEGNVILIPQQLLRDIWNGLLSGRPMDTKGAKGSYAVRTLIAHEYAHAYLREVSVVNNKEVTTVDELAPTYSELIADCVAGNIIANTPEFQPLSEENLRAAKEILYAAGDNAPGAEEVIEGSEHGSSRERVAAFETGLNDKDNTILSHQCVKQYWIS